MLMQHPKKGHPRRELYGYLELGGALGAAAWWYFDSSAGFKPLLICLSLWGLGRLGKALGWWDNELRTPFDLPLLGFLLSAAVALWATYRSLSNFADFSSPAGSDKFWLIAGACFVFYALARLPSLRSIQVGMMLAGLFSAGISTYFLASYNFSGSPEKFQFIQSMGRFIQELQPAWQIPAPQPNWAGGLAAVFLPGILETLRVGFQVSSNVKKLGIILAAGAELCLSGLGILLSSSRGAWIGLAVGLGAWAGVWILDRIAEKAALNRKTWDRWLGALLIGCVGLSIASIYLLEPRLAAIFPPLAKNVSYFPRPELQNTAALLVKDYPFTGSGLGTFPMVFSAYTLLINVPAIVDAHNLMLDLAISQGLPGLFTWLVILLGAFSLAWQSRLHNDQRQKLPLAGACVMLIIMLVHGLVEDPYYDSRAVLFLLAPVGLIAALARQAATPADPFVKKITQLSAGVLLGGGILLLAGIWLLPSWHAAYLANRGALAQTQVELSAYDPDHFDNPTLDTVRRQAHLSQAQSFFDQALSIDPRQVSALQRLAEIALSTKKYDQALVFAQDARSVDPANRVTRLLLGDALVANGKPQAAAALAGGLPFARGRLSGESWYRYHLDGDQGREIWADLADQAIK